MSGDSGPCFTGTYVDKGLSPVISATLSTDYF